MIDNKDDMSILKADAHGMEENYYELFRLDCRRLYFYLITRARKAIFALLTRPRFRPHWIGESAVAAVYENISTELASLSTIKQVLQDDMVIEKRNTEGMWDPIVPQGTTVMVLAIAKDSFVKNAGQFSEKLGISDINGDFPLF